MYLYDDPDFLGKEQPGVWGIQWRHPQGTRQGQGPDTPTLSAGPDDLPQLRPRVLLPGVLPATPYLPTVPPGDRPVPPDLPQQLSPGCQPQAQTTSTAWRPGSPAHCLLWTD